jgi:hypothetical protein
MPQWVLPSIAVLSGILNAVQFLLGTVYRKRDDAMKFGEHWRGEASALLEENERLRQRIDDTEKHCAAELAALKIDNETLEKRLIELIKQGRAP